MNETQEYLGGDSGAADERHAVAIKGLLADSRRAPVLVVGTLWPGDYDALRRGRASQAGKLLEGNVITVPERFTGADLDGVRRAAITDPRMKMALEQAEDGQITQYLAGGPELIERYLNPASAAVRAIIDVAIDARRMGHRNALPYALLRDAAPAYMTNVELDGLEQDWLDRALAETSRECKGVRGPVTRIHSQLSRRPSGRRTRAARQNGVLAADVPAFQLADYLYQYGRAHRAHVIPPIGFWEEIAFHAHTDDLARLGDAAWDRGLYRDGAQLWKLGARHGSARAARALAHRVYQLDPTDDGPLAWAVQHASLDNTASVTDLLAALLEAGASDQATALAQRAAPQVNLDNASGVARLLRVLRDARARDQIMVLAERAAPQVNLDNAAGVAELLLTLREARATDQVVALAHRMAAYITVDAVTVGRLVANLRRAGATDQAIVLVQRAARELSLDKPGHAHLLLRASREAGAFGLFIEVARAAQLVLLEDSSSVAALLETMWQERATEEAESLACRAARGISVDNADGVAHLLEVLRERAPEQVIVLAQRAAERASRFDMDSVAKLAEALWEVGAIDQVAIAARAAHQISVDAHAASTLLVILWRARATDLVKVLAKRAARHVPLDDAAGVALLLDTLRHVQAPHAITVLAQRAAYHVSLTDPAHAVYLVLAMQEFGAFDAVLVLAHRAARQVFLDAAADVTELIEALRAVGAPGAALVLALRAAREVAVDDTAGVASLLRVLQEVAPDQVGALAHRAARETSVDYAGADGVASLLRVLQAEAPDQLIVLAQRTVRRAPRYRPDVVIQLLNALREVGMTDEIAALTALLPNFGMFSLFLRIGDHQERFRLGCEPDGSPAVPWTWQDLG
ncbi:hypothetical protein AB0E01_17100 [Nocardia vinacea]|uniref:hypothetical protein n=1 Tax=Nocardia vinacea TaxID=96468 RepID=UPI0033DEFACD